LIKETQILSFNSFPKAYSHQAIDTVLCYTADVIPAPDYYPFGSPIPGRSMEGDGYRFGFNGKEMDDEVSGNGNQYDYGFRIYNPRLGRFLSVDPLTRSYPWYTPYQFAGNKPIWKVDIDGLEEGTIPDNKEKTKLEFPSSSELKLSFSDDAREKIYKYTEDPEFAKNFNITHDESGQKNLANLLLNTALRETPQYNRKEVYSGRVVVVVTQLKDQNLISEDNPDGFIPNTYRRYTIPEEWIPQNTSSTLNPGINPNTLPEARLGDWKSIVYTINVTIDFLN